MCTEHEIPIAEKGKIYPKEDVKLPPGLVFGTTTNPDGKNVFTDPNSEIRPVFSL